MAPDLHCSVKPVYYLSRFAFFWPFKYKNGQIVPLSVTEKALAALLIVLHLVWLFWSLHRRTITPRVKVHVSQSLLDDISTFSATLYTLVAIVSVIIKKNVDLSTSFFKQLTSIDKVLQLNHESHRKCFRSLRNRALIQILLVTGIAVTDNMMWVSRTGLLITTYYFQSYVMYILNNVVTLQIDCKILLLRERFTVLNDRLSDMIDDVTGNRGNEKIVRPALVQHTEEVVRSFNKIFDVLCDLIESINKCHGFEIIILALTILTVALNTLVIGFTLFRSVSEETEEVVSVSMQFLWSAYYIILGMILTNSTSSTVKLARKTSILGHKLLLEYSSRSEDFEKLRYAKEELKLLIEQVAYRNPGFSAAGFFAVDYTMLYAIVGAVTSYFIVLLQLP